LSRVRIPIPPLRHMFSLLNLARKSIVI